MPGAVTDSHRLNGHEGESQVLVDGASAHPAHPGARREVRHGIIEHAKRVGQAWGTERLGRCGVYGVERVLVGGPLRGGTVGKAGIIDERPEESIKLGIRF